MICSRHAVASVQDIKIVEALLILRLAYYVYYETSLTLLKLKHDGFHVSRYVCGVHYTSIFSVFSIMASWIAEMHFMLSFADITV